MRGFSHPDADLAAPGSWLRAQDAIGRQHVVRLDEATIHHRSLACPCRPKVRDFVIVHRVMRNSRALFQPWERGH